MKQTGQGIIAEHFIGVGTVTRDMVAERAREIAVINGRSPHHYTRDDFIEAKRELTGNAAVDGDEDGVLTAITHWDEEPGSAGRPIEKTETTDEETIAELLVEEGVSEAEHEQMVEGARRHEEQE